MILEGYGPYQIATQLSAEHIPIPAYHQSQLGVGLWKNREIKYPYKWTSSTIAHILQKHEYLGHTVNFKTRKHFKDKKALSLIILMITEIWNTLFRQASWTRTIHFSARQYTLNSKIWERSQKERLFLQWMETGILK